MMKLSPFFFLLLILGISSCVTSNGSYAPAAAYVPHLTGSGTGQVYMGVRPPLGQIGLDGGGVCALGRHVFVQANGRWTKGVSTGTEKRIDGEGAFHYAQGEALLGGYLVRRGYQSLSFGLGAGGGNTNLVKINFNHGKLKLGYLAAQIGCSESYGNSRLSLGLRAQLMQVLGGSILYSGVDETVQAIRLLELNNEFPTVAVTAGYSYSVSGPLRLHLQTTFQIVGADYDLFDKDVFTVGFLYDIQSRRAKKR